MSQTISSRLQQAIESVEQLSRDDQAMLIEIIRRRLIEQRRDEMAEEIAEARAASYQGKVHRGTVADLTKELAE